MIGILKGMATLNAIVACYRKIVTRVLQSQISKHAEILAVDKIPRHLLNLTMNGNLRRIKRYSPKSLYSHTAYVAM